MAAGVRIGTDRRDIRDTGVTTDRIDEGEGAVDVLVAVVILGLAAEFGPEGDADRTARQREQVVTRHLEVGQCQGRP